jgi:starvation-inducible DNA-binding protein
MLDNQNPNMIVQKPELVEALAELLGNDVVMYFKAHGHHWNVMGRDFAQFHKFFSKIYEDILAQFDPIAENMRKLGSLAPYTLAELSNLSQMQDMDCGSDAMLMVQDLYEANNVMLKYIDDAFQIASDLDEQGIANYLAERDDKHKMWRWQLTAYLSPTQADSLGKSEAVQPVVVGDTEKVTPMVEQLMNDADGCPLCGYGECVCPGCEGGICLCSEACACPHCHVVMSGSEDFDEDQQQEDMPEEVIAYDEPFDDLGSYEEYGALIAAGKSPCWDGYKQVGMKKGKNGNMVPNCVPVDAADDSDSELAASRRAPKKDRIYGSKRNAPGSAKGGKKIVFSQKVENSLRNKVEEHNKNASAGRKATLPMLKAVYRRGSGAFSSSHRPGKTRDQWAMARVNAFLKLLRSGRPSNPNYKQDNDLLPKAHPRSSRGEASLLQHELLEVALKSADEYGSPEHAIFSMAEYTGLGYEVIPALRGAWLRGVRDGDVPFQRAYELATNLYNSKDSDLLPKKRRRASGE